MASVLQRERLASTPEPPLPKEKGKEHHIVRRERLKVSEKEEDQSESGEERVDSTVKEGDSKEEKEGKQEEPI